jgi:hypothetical protein
VHFVHLGLSARGDNESVDQLQILKNLRDTFCKFISELAFLAEGGLAALGRLQWLGTF